MDLEFDIGAAEARVDLSGLSITSLDLEVGAADCQVWWDAANLSTLSELTVDCGVSSLSLEGLGYAGLEYMDFEGGLGSFKLDFSGAWTASAEAHLEVGLGSLDVTVPRDIGVRIEAEHSFGSVDVDRWFKEVDDDVYESENYRNANIKLVLMVELGMGSLDVRAERPARP
jgi:Cell wall-active antibiotics response LiaF, C-terminal